MMVFFSTRPILRLLDSVFLSRKRFSTRYTTTAASVVHYTPLFFASVFFVIKAELQRNEEKRIMNCRNLFLKPNQSSAANEDGQTSAQRSKSYSSDQVYIHYKMFLKK